MSRDEKLNQILEKLDNLTTSHNEMSKKLDSIAEHNGTLEEKIAGNENSIRELRSDLSKIGREKNLIIYNIEDKAEYNTDVTQTVRRIFEQVKLDIPDVALDDAFRLGKVKGSRPILVKFISARWVHLVFEKVEELKQFKITISNDLTREERDEKRKLLQLRYNLRKAGHKADIKRNQLLLNGSPITLAAATLLLQNHQPTSVASNQKKSSTDAQQRSYANLLRTPKRSSAEVTDLDAITGNLRKKTMTRKETSAETQKTQSTTTSLSGNETRGTQPPNPTQLQTTLEQETHH